MSSETPHAPRVVHLTSVHDAFDTRIFHRECKSLAMAGYDVTLVAPRAEGDLVADGIRVKGVAPPQDRRRRITHTVPEVYRAALQENAEIYHFHDPELMLLSPLLKMHGKKVIYDVHEDYTATMQDKHWIPGLLRRPAALTVGVCERAFVRACDRVIAATPKIANRFDVARTRLVQNFPWCHELRCPDSRPYRERDPIAVYIGVLADVRGLRQMRQAVELAAREVSVKLVTAGRTIAGATTDLQDGSRNGLVEHMGQLSRSQVRELLVRARLGLVVLHATGNYVQSQPTKMFEYMSAGLPIVASDFPLWREIVESAGCGLLVDPLKPEEIAEAVVWLLRNPSQAAQMGRNGQRAVMEKYNWERESERLIATYAELHIANGAQSCRY